MPSHSPADDIHALYDSSGADIDLAAFLRARPPCSPDQLADLIEADGRARLDRGLLVDLHRYLDAVPGLRSCEDALDAAIDMALRALSGSGRPTDDAVRTLVARHPDLALAIADAAQLNLALGGFSTHPRGHDSGPLTPPLPTPCEFGPRDSRGVPRYLLRRFLGAGASGIVYEAIDRALSEPDHEALIAIKVLRSQAAHPRIRDAFFEEATKVRRISHPAVVRVEDCGIAESGDPYLVYEFLPRGDLQHFLHSQPGPIHARRAAELVARIARGVHAAHSAGLIHCDLKPSNVLLDEDGYPKVGDFGVAIRLGQFAGNPGTAGSPSPASSRAGGNLAFMSPEQYRMDAAAVSTAADIYALGGLLFYLLTKTPPNGTTPGEVDLAHDLERGRREAVSVRAARSDVPADLDIVCRRALSPAPKERHDSAAALADDLERWLNRRPIPWTRPSLLKVFGLWIRRRPVIAALVFALITVAVSGSATGASLWYLAVEREAQATKAEAQASLEKIVRERIYAASNFMLAIMKPHIVMETDTSILPETFYLEWVFGPTMLDTPEQLADLWARRIKIARSELTKLANAAPAGSSDGLGPRDLRTLLWEFTLGLWLTKSGDPVEAEAILDRNYQKWSEIMPWDQELLGRVDAVRATARTRQLISAPQRDQAALLAAAVDLDQRAQALHAASGRTIIHLLLLRTLEELYGPRLLQDAPALKNVEKQLKPYEDFGVPASAPPKAGKPGRRPALPADQPAPRTVP